MQIARVAGTVVSTNKSDKLLGLKLMVVRAIDLDTFEEKGAPIVSIDAVGAGVGEVVMLVSGSSSRQTAATDAKPVDNSIVAIIDSIDIGGNRIFDKHGQKDNGAKDKEKAGKDT
jgi:microcompartment protein CcmK/EutM